MRPGILVIAAGHLAACSFSLTAAPGDVGGDTVLSDAPLPDAGECTGASQSCAGPGTLRTCGASGPAVDETCAWGCVAGTPDHCGVLVPAGGALGPSDLDPAGLADVTVGTATINGDTGLVSGPVTGAFVHKLVGGIAVFRANSVRFDGAVSLRGSRPIVFAANGNIVVAGSIDARGSCALTAAGPGGSLGGEFVSNGGGAGGGRLAPAGVGPGAGGGGYGAAGGPGGNGDGTGALGGLVHGDAAITVLFGGSGGGGGGGGGGNNGVGVGGGGGGAIQLASNGAIRIETTGLINASGCGGKGSNNDSNDGSGGGGSGGTILLEAPTVEILGALAVNGGGGGGCQDQDGSAGSSMRSAAPGGNATVDGGPGGFAAALAGASGSSNANTGGGGGGGVGRIRVNTRTGAVAVPGMTMSPGFDDVPTTATRSAANVQ